MDRSPIHSITCTRAKSLLAADKATRQELAEAHRALIEAQATSPEPGHLHTFRHRFISAALTSGVPEAIVREWVGRVAQDIIRHYTHIADAASKEAMKTLAAGKKTGRI